MAASFTSYFDLYVEKYWKGGIADLWFETDKETCPVLASMETRTWKTGGGRKIITPIETLPGSSVSADFTTAQNKAAGSTQGSSTEHDRWETDAMNMHGIAQWSRETVLAAEDGGSAAGAIDVIDREMRSKMAVMKKRWAIASVEQGWGRVSTITAVDSTSITISTNDVNRVIEGDDLTAATSIDGAALKNAAGTIRVTFVNVATGQLTMSSDPLAGTAWAVGDIVFQAGDRENSATPTRRVPTGLAGWVPQVAPGATLFNGVARNTSWQLGGLRFDASSFDHASAFIRATEQLVRFTGTKPSAIYCSNTDFATLCVDRDATKIIEIQVGKNKIGFSGTIVQGSFGSVPVIPDVFVPQGIAWVGPFSDARYAPYIAHNREIVNIDNLDGNKFLRLSASASYEARLFSRGNIVVPAPSKFMIIHSLPV